MAYKKVFLIPCCDYKDINPVDSGYHECPPGFHYGPSERDYHILHFVISGKGILRKNDTEYTVCAGQCFMIRSEEVAYYRSDDHEPWTYVWLGFKTSLPLPDRMKNDDVFDGVHYKSVFIPIADRRENKSELSVFCAASAGSFSL